MRLTKVSISNFKALKSTTFDLAAFNVIMGQNGSGKSSILQALHWIIQSARNPAVDTNKKDTDGSTLSLSNANYMPSPDYKNAGNEGEFGNFKNAKRMDVTLHAVDEGGHPHDAALWLKAASNEGVSVHIPSNNDISAAIHNRSQEFSAYIPGLAGIPLAEEKRSESIVLRQAAAGDANTVLRNVLWLLQQKPGTPEIGDLSDLQTHVSRAIRDTKFDIRFDEASDYTINARFKTSEMAEWRPLELAGIGFLQVIQIFAYIVYFKPRLLLIDEPDSHLHPEAQTRLIREIHTAARTHNCQVIMTSHSPSVIRALTDGAQVIWMENGQVSKTPDQARQRMGWGLLDKELVLLTEDSKTDLLRLLLSQWPDLERRVAIWPLGGCGNLPKADVLRSLRALLGDVATLLHRNADMMTDHEKDPWRQKWKLETHEVWITKGADIESYFCDPAYCAAVLNRTEAELCTDIFANLTATATDTDFAKKRDDARALYAKGDEIPSNTSVFAELSKQGFGHVRKKSISPLRAKIQQIYKAGAEQKIGKTIPTSTPLALDLKRSLQIALDTDPEITKLLS